VAQARRGTALEGFPLVILERKRIGPGATARHERLRVVLGFEQQDDSQRRDPCHEDSDDEWTSAHLGHGS
jgi:hypothetical protein